MKKHAWIICLGILVFVSCSKDKGGWQGTFEQVNGLINVKNPDEPFYGDSKIF